MERKLLKVAVCDLKLTGRIGGGGDSESEWYKDRGGGSEDERNCEGEGKPQWVRGEGR